MTYRERQIQKVKDRIQQRYDRCARDVEVLEAKLVELERSREPVPVVLEVGVARKWHTVWGALRMDSWATCPNCSHNISRSVPVGGILGNCPKCHLRYKMPYLKEEKNP